MTSKMVHFSILYIIFESSFFLNEFLDSVLIDVKFLLAQIQYIIASHFLISFFIYYQPGCTLFSNMSSEYEHTLSA